MKKADLKCAYCGEPYSARVNGTPYCNKHYQKVIRYGTPEGKRRERVNTFTVSEGILTITTRSGADIIADPDDLERLQIYSWCISKTGYAVSRINGKVVKMHRYIMNAPEDMVVDHINHNTLDNRKENLRICTPKDNARNVRPTYNSRTGEVGIRETPHGKFNVRITVDRKQLHIGNYDTLEEAVAARKEAEAKYHGEFGAHQSKEDKMVEELSLVIQNPEEGDFLKRIDWNKEAFMELVASITKNYQGIVYTDDQIKMAKNDRAKLNAMKKQISDRRIQVKNAIMQPYTQFEKEVAEVTRLIDEPIAMIDSQIKGYENRVKEEKEQSLRQYYDGIASDLDGILTFDKVFDSRYLNVSVSLNKAKEDMQSKVDRVRTDLRSLEAFCEDKYLAVAKDAYVKTLDVSKALAEAKRIQEFDRRAEEERLRRQEEKEREAAKAAENVIKPQENVIKEPETVAEQPKSAAEHEETVPQSEVGKAIASAERQAYEQSTSGGIDVPDPASKVQEADTKKYKASFTVYGTKAQIMALRDYMNEHNIKFGKVER